MFYNFKGICLNVNHIIRITKLFTNEIEIEYYTINTVHHEVVYYDTEAERDNEYADFVNIIRK